jgi:hypothetical protein
MSTVSRMCLSLAVFLLIAGTVYGLTSHEHAGTALLLAAAATFCYLGLVSRMVARAEAGSDSEEMEIHVAPTIWPFGFAVAAVIIAFGLIITPWILIAGAVVFVLSAAGWIREVGRSRAHAGHP